MPRSTGWTSGLSPEAVLTPDKAWGFQHCKTLSSSPTTVNAFVNSQVFLVSSRSQQPHIVDIIPSLLTEQIKAGFMTCSSIWN